MSTLSDYVQGFESKSPEWRKGWDAWHDDPFERENPYTDERRGEWDAGYDEAVFVAKVDGGYFDE